MRSPTTVLRLEETRRKKGVSLEEIADATKISTTFLRAIESEEFEKLPGGVYNTNYIRQYALAIDYSQDELLALYRETETGRPSEPEPDPRFKSNFKLRWISWLVSPAIRH